MLAKALYKAYAIPSYTLRSVICKIVKRLEGGEMYSETLRRIYLNYHDIAIGLYSYGGCFNLRNIPSGTRIGRYGSFANFKVFPRNHSIDCISMHPFFYNPSLGYVTTDNIPFTNLSIGHGVWIGYGAFILPRVTKIGNGAVVAAAAVVTKNVPPYAVMAGNPAVVIKYRFPKAIINHIEKTAWWEEDIEKLAEDIDEFTTPVDVENYLSEDIEVIR
jgi:acetyltransferase-like isoleucine patch superfamily enzyme